eukprot:TRINITY_DN387_c0_g1_i1.p1 TRINITY_DN387_c0_g1~~TRINITY_DN387_c0_g1_i1.p1  ORF type:complete len:269 (-),score=68.73 TRINITY_DN387_c0_g1_i1:76-816(-)
MGASAENEQLLEQVTVQSPPETISTPSPLDYEPLIQRSARGLFSLIMVQTIIAILSIFNCGLLFSIVNLIIMSFATLGTSRRRPGLIAVHFVYSIIVYVLSLMMTMNMIFYDVASWWTVAAVFLTIGQAVGLRHERNLMYYISMQNRAMVTLLTQAVAAASEPVPAPFPAPAPVPINPPAHVPAPASPLTQSPYPMMMYVPMPMGPNVDPASLPPFTPMMMPYPMQYPYPMQPQAELVNDNQPNNA